MMRKKKKKSRNLLHFVKDYAGGLRDSKDAHSGTKESQEQNNEVVGARQQKDIIVLDAVGLVRGIRALAIGFRSSWRRGTLAPSRAGFRHYE